MNLLILKSSHSIPTALESCQSDLALFSLLPLAATVSLFQKQFLSKHLRGSSDVATIRRLMASGRSMWPFGLNSMCSRGELSVVSEVPTDSPSAAGLGRVSKFF